MFLVAAVIKYEIENTEKTITEIKAMIKMTMPAMVPLTHLLGVRMTKFGHNLDLRVESWTGIVPGRVESEDMMIVQNLTRYWMRPTKTFGYIWAFWWCFSFFFNEWLINQCGNLFASKFFVFWKKLDARKWITFKLL